MTSNTSPQPFGITSAANGSLWVTGGIPITTADGVVLAIRNRVTLGRGGASANKPLCDGRHKEARFRES